MAKKNIQVGATLDAEALAQEKLILEQRKVKALEKIGTSLDALTIWFEEIEKDEWSERIQFYLAKWLEVKSK